MWYYTIYELQNGEMSEWFKEPVLKTGDSFCEPWVRIPLSPPEYFHTVKIIQKDPGFGPVGTRIRSHRARARFHLRVGADLTFNNVIHMEKYSSR